MNHLVILMNVKHEHDGDDYDDEDRKDENHHNEKSDGAENADEDHYVYCLLNIFPNAIDNQV